MKTDGIPDTEIEYVMSILFPGSITKKELPKAPEKSFWRKTR